MRQGRPERDRQKNEGVYTGKENMSKRETIDQIRRFNPSAQTDFLASFDQDELLAYLHQLQEVERERVEHAHWQHEERFALAMA